MTKKLMSKRLGSIVTQRLKQRRQSVSALAKQSGLALGVAQKIAAGSGNPTLFTLKKLAKALNMQIVIWPRDIF